MKNAIVISISLTLVLLDFLVPEFAVASIKGEMFFRSKHRLMAFSRNEDKSLGQEHWLKFESLLSFSKSLSLQAEVLASAGDYRTSLYQKSDKTDLSNQASEIWPGDMYFQYASRAVLARFGYQRISWHEGFSSSYTNFINPRDQRISFFEDADLVFRSVPMMNLIASGDSLSLQLLFIPFTAIDLLPPFSRLGGKGGIPLLPSQKVEVRDLESSSSVLNYGARTTWAGEGFDVSVFAARIQDRQALYELNPISDSSRLLLEPTQTAMSTFGITSSIVTGESTWRIEYMHIPSRRFGRISGPSLEGVERSESDVTLGFESPAWGKLSLELQHSISILNKEIVGGLREAQESLSFARLDYSFGDDRTLRLLAAYLHADRSLFGRVGYSWPLNQQVELEIAVEAAGGPLQSQGAAMSGMSRIFGQITHTL